MRTRSRRIDQAATIFWLKAHGRGEKRLASRIEAFLIEQAERMAQETELGLTAATALLNPEVESAKLLRTIHPELMRLMAQGAKSELDRFENRKTFDGGTPFEFELPEHILQGVAQSLEELEAQSYWVKLQTQTQANLANLIEEGIRNGQSGYQMARTIRDQLGGKPAYRRALRIARTETSGSLNAGHQATYDGLAGSGLITGKRWITIGDEDARSDHVALNETTVAASGEFIVGTTPAPYPAHWSLPPEQRINCRCLTVADIIE